MNKIIATFLLVFIVCTVSGEGIERDKLLHFSYSLVLTTSLCQTAKYIHIKNYELVGTFTALSIGMGKEFIVDKYIFHKAPNAYDLGANFLGCIAGLYLNKLICKWETKHFKK